MTLRIRASRALGYIASAFIMSPEGSIELGVTRGACAIAAAFHRSRRLRSGVSIVFSRVCETVSVVVRVAQRWIDSAGKMP